jgi:hypothetical protein
VEKSKTDEALLKAETADNDKAVFFSFLCHELRYQPTNQPKKKKKKKKKKLFKL